MTRVCLLALLMFVAPLMAREPQKLPSGAAIDRQVEGLLAHTGAKGLAIAVIERGRVTYV